MIQVNNLHQQFGGQLLFENVSFNVQKGERLGLVGRNGAGKSTLFAMILGKLTPDQGEIIIPKGYKIGSLEQHIHFTKSSVLEECTQVLTGDKMYNFFEAERILSGLGFSAADFEKDPASFSGGYQIRINLCKCLLIEPDLLLLDEPTNYLDILSLRWLRGFLRSFMGEVLLITHDRDFMDSVTTHTMGIYRKNVKKIKGDTHKFYEQMVLEDEIYEKTRLNQIRKKEHLEAFVERFGAKASKATQAQSKAKQLEKMDVLERLNDEASMGLRFQYKECPGKVIMEVLDVSFAYPEGEDLFAAINFSIGRRDRIGIIGKNGKGKSTLLNVLAGELTPTQGKITSHPSLKIGHLGQTNVNRLHGNSTIIEEIAAANPALPTTSVRNICGSMMFDGDLAKKKISVLSGGEKSRVLLGKIIAGATNLLLLDEPTNHLDMESIEILKEEIKNYPGAVVIVTHSEALLREVVDHLIIFNRDNASTFMGTYDEFLEKIGWDEEDAATGADSAKSKKKNISRKDLLVLRQAIIKERSGICSPLTKELEQLEQLIVAHESELAEQTALLDAASLEQNGELVLMYSQRIGELQDLIDAAFGQMERLELDLKRHEQHFAQLLLDLENV